MSPVADWHAIRKFNSPFPDYTAYNFEREKYLNSLRKAILYVKENMANPGFGDNLQPIEQDALDLIMMINVS